MRPDVKGRMSRRALSLQAARAMILVREARQAYQHFHAQCFWAFDPKYRIGLSDVDWVAQQLRQHGGRDAWDVASKLCRWPSKSPVVSP